MSESASLPEKNILPPRPSAPLPLSHHPGLFIALIAYLFLAGCYLFIVPIFEAPDEWTHTGHVKYIAEGNGLPVMLPGQGIWGGQQPPLYYALGALLAQPFKLDEFDDYLKSAKNPHASLGYALDPGNKNNFLHTSAETLPYHGLSLAVHVLRLYSMVYGLIALVFIYFTAFELSRDWRLEIGNTSVVTYQSLISNLFPIVVALFVACQPMFAFITVSVANEPANIAFCAIGLWLAQRYVLTGPSPHWRRAAALGVVMGLISLSKMTGLSFGLVAAAAFLITAITRRKQPGAAMLLWRDGLIIGLLFLLVGGWWYWRNYQLYGDFFQQGLYKLYFKVDPQPLTLSEFLYTLSTGEVSFWATFGWLNIVAPEWVYSLYRIISRVGLVGIGVMIVLQMIRWRAGGQEGRRTGEEILPQPVNLAEGTHPRRTQSGVTFQPSNLPTLLHPSSFILHLLFPLALAFSLTRLVATEGGLQGRQLLPALGSMAIVIIGGWWALAPPRWRWPVLGLLLVVLFSLAVWLPFGVVAPAYIPQPLLAKADLPADVTRLDWSYNGEIKLVGVNIGATAVRPGERVPVTAYWQALKPMETNYSVFVHLIGRSNRNVGQFNTFPGLGLRPTRSLQPGQIVADTYPVLVEGGSAAPTRLLVNLGLFDFKAAGRPGLPALNPQGQAVPPAVGWLKLVPAAWPPYGGEPPLAEFAGHIWLIGYEMNGCTGQNATCEVRLKWLAQGRPVADYTVFIHLWRDGQKATGFDTQPLSGDYPTSLWEAGEVILDPHPLDLAGLPPGDYQMLAGLYNLASGDRLPATSNGVPLSNFVVDLGMIQIE
ncbi:MAG: hypothetical protein U0401_31225 [Anaerolineae bacterium]